MLKLKVPTRIFDGYLLRDKGELKCQFSIWLGEKEELIAPDVNSDEWTCIAPLYEWFSPPGDPDTTYLTKEEIISLGVTEDQLPKPGQCKKIKIETPIL